jgi:hypothetical protein
VFSIGRGRHQSIRRALSNYESPAPKAIFIAGLTHSGSTLLDLVLGSQGRLIGIGEVAPLLHPSSPKLQEADRRCSCGENLSTCVYWGEVLRSLQSRNLTSWLDRYRHAYDVFYSVFGNETILVDSSKSLRSLRLVASMNLPQLRVIHLTRDVRSWTVSRLDVDRRRKMYAVRDLYRIHGLKAWRPILMRGPSARFMVWYYGNRRIAEFIEGLDVRTCAVSYEELALDTSNATDRLLNFVGEEVAATETIGSSKSHIALGNSMRLKPERREIRYDIKWLYRREWQIPTLIFPHIMNYNMRTTYLALRSDPTLLRGASAR